MGIFTRLQPSRPDRAIHGYVYYRWTTRYIAIVRFFLERGHALGGARDFAARRLARTHHAKVVSTEDARRVIEIDKPIELRGLEHVVPYPVARDIVLSSPARIALATCACRASAAKLNRYDGSCGPAESCLYIGDPIASFVVEKQPSARFITQEEAVALVSEAAERGNVHTLWFKDAAADRMYAICNCCSFCCIGLQSQREGFSPLAGSGYVASVDEATCTSCGRCVEACAFGAVTLAAGRGAAIDADRCLGCGVCEHVCADGAIAMLPAASGPAPVPWSRGGES